MTTKKDSSNTLSSILKGEFITEKSNTKLIPFFVDDSGFGFDKYSILF